MADFKLRAELRGHEEDVCSARTPLHSPALVGCQTPLTRVLLPSLQVRSVCITPEGAVLTGSRDKTIKLWTEGPDGTFTATTTLVGGLRACWGHQQLGRCCRQRSRRQHSRRQRSSAGGSAATHAQLPPTPLPAPATPLQVGHTDFVSALAYAAPGVLQGCPNGAVVSGSRDTTVRVWDPQTAAVLQTLEGHQYQVGWLG